MSEVPQPAEVTWDADGVPAKVNRRMMAARQRVQTEVGSVTKSEVYASVLTSMKLLASAKLPGKCKLDVVLDVMLHNVDSQFRALFENEGALRIFVTKLVNDAYKVFGKKVFGRKRFGCC